MMVSGAASQGGTDLLSVTFLLVTYRQETFVEEALEAALAQDYAPLQIIVSDDCSPDRTFEVIQRKIASYDGPVDVTAVRNPKNLGLVGNINAAMTLVKGELVVVAAGDDISVPSRTTLIAGEYIRSNRQAKSIYSNAMVINETSVNQGLYFRSARAMRVDLPQLSAKDFGVLGCTQAWTKELFDVFGPLDPGVRREDAVIPFRAAILGHVAYLDMPLVRYRRHGTNLHFRPAGATRDRATLYDGLRRHSAGNVSVVTARLQDLGTLRTIGLESPSSIDAEVASKRLLAEKLLEHRLLEERRLRQALTILEGAAVARVPPRRILRWVLLAFSPRLYLWYQRRQSRGMT